MFKRGMAGVVVIVLTILITIVATGTVWVVVKDQLDSGTENFKTSDCFAVDLSVTSCIYDSNNVAVLIKKGSNQIEISNAKLIFDNQGSPGVIEINNTLPQPLGARQFVFTRAQVPNPSTVNIAAILGGEIVCSPSSEKVACTTTPNAIVNNNSNNTNNNTSQTGWNKLNGGNPIDGGESFEPIIWMASANQIATVKDSHGNLFYSFLGENSNYLYLGRINSTKSWDVLTFNQWSRNAIDVLKPVSQNRFMVSKIKMFNWPNENKIIGTFAAVSGASNNRLDIHDRAYSFSFDGQNPKYWSSSQGYNNNTVTPLSSSIFGTPGYNHDSDKNENIILAASNVLHGPRWLTAARYKNGVWENWQNNAWAQPTNLVYSQNNLNVLALPNSLVGISDKAPVVTSIPGTQDFIVTYYSQDLQTSLISLKAVKYDDSTEAWSWWNGGWQTNTAISPQPLASGFTNSDSDNLQRRAFVKNDTLYNLYLKYGGQSYPTLYLLPYNLTSQTWGAETAIFQAHNFIISKDDFGQTWIACSNQSNITLSQFSNGTLSVPENVYSLGAGNVRLMGLDFLNSKPIIFIGEGNSQAVRLYALGKSEDWTDEKIRTPISQSLSTVLNETYGREMGQFDTGVLENITYLGAEYLIESSYGTQLCGHMALDSENNLYCPKVIVNGLGIFPENYSSTYTFQNETAHHWGGWWDYLYFPSGVAVDNALGKVYVTDNIVEGNEIDGVSTGNLQVWDKSWNDENVMRDIPDGSGSTAAIINPLLWTPAVYTQAEFGHNLDWPSDSAINEQRNLLYVTETNFNRVLIYNISTGAPIFLKAFGSEGNGPGQFDHPEGIDTDSAGNVYVVDSRNNRIEKFDYDGNLLTQWGSIGRENGQFIYPYSISVDKVKNYAYVTDPGNHRIQIFNLSGNFVYTFREWVPKNNLPENMRIFQKMGGIVVKNNTLYASSTGAINYPKIARFQMNLP